MKPLQQVLFKQDNETAWRNYLNWCNANNVPGNARLTKNEHAIAYQNSKNDPKHYIQNGA